MLPHTGIMNIALHPGGTTFTTSQEKAVEGKEVGPGSAVEGS